MTKPKSKTNGPRRGVGRPRKADSLTALVMVRMTPLGRTAREIAARIAAQRTVTSDVDLSTWIRDVTEPEITPEFIVGVEASVEEGLITRGEADSLLTTDVGIDEARDVGSIRYRLHPIPAAPDRRMDRPARRGRRGREGAAVAIDASDDPIRVSYPDAHGERRVMSGPQRAVLARLRSLGFEFVVGGRPGGRP